MDESSDFSVKQKLDIKNHTDELWNVINEELIVKFKDLHARLGSDTVNIGAIGDQISQTIYDTVSQHFGTINNENRRFYKPKSQSNLLQQAKVKLAEERKKLRQRKGEKSTEFIQALRAYSEISRKVNHSQRVRAQAKHEKSFRRDFHEYVSRELGNSRSNVQPGPNTRDTVTQSLKEIYDPVQNSEYNYDWWTPYEDPVVEFDLSPITPKDVKKAVSRMKNFSSPGLDGIQPIVIKKLPAVHHILATLFNKLVSTSQVPPSWQQGIMLFIFKKGDTQDIRNYRPITLTSVVCKLFHSIVNRRLCAFLVDNQYLDQCVQKGFQKGIKGCVDHSLLLSKLIYTVRKKRHSAHIMWVDIANAFGSVPHEVLSRALQSLHVPQWLQSYIKNFYSNIKVVAKTTHYFSCPIRISQGVFQGDTISPTLFLAVFNQILRYLDSEKQHGVAIKEEKVHALAFADDLTLVCKDARSAQRIITSVNSKLKSVGLNIKPAKCFSLSLKSGCVDRHRTFLLDGTPFKSILEEPMKFLGLRIFHKHQAANSAKYLSTKLNTLLKEVDRLPLRGQYKLEIYHRYVTACVRFDLQVCDMAKSSLDSLDITVRNYLRKWCRMPKSTHIAHAFHSWGLNLDLPSHLYTVGHAATLSSIPSHDSALKEASQVALDELTKHVAQEPNKVIIELSQDSVSKQQLKKKGQAAKDEMMVEHAKSCSKQGMWLETLGHLDNEISWKSTLSGLSEPTYLFVLRSMVDALPTNSNLALWKKLSSSSCGSCGSNKQTLLHVLNNCDSKLKLYAWRHDNILFQLNNFVQSCLPNCDIKCDLAIENNAFTDRKTRTVPPDIYITDMRPDIVIIERAIKHITLLELTVPFETNFFNAQDRKSKKYSTLVAGLQEVGYDCKFLTIEVGSRGIAPHGICKLLRQLCKSSHRQTKEIVKKMCHIAMQCSYVIFQEKDNAGAMFQSIISQAL